MVGAVLHQELLVGSRRIQLYYLRLAYAAWLVLQIFFFWMRSVIAWGSGPQSYGEFFSSFVEALLVQNFFVLLLVVPTVVAGAITDEKARGTLQFLLTADLLPWEIVLGKLLGRVFHILVLVLLALPLLCFFGMFAGWGAGILFSFVLLTVFVALGLGAASLLASVWARHTRDAVLSLYCLLTALLLGMYLLHGTVLGDFLRTFDPVYALSLGEDSRRMNRVLASLSAWVALIVVCVVLASFRLRRAYVKQLENTRKRSDRWWHVKRMPVFGDPLRWKERQVEGIAPLAPLRRIPRWLAISLVVIATLISSGGILVNHLPPGSGQIWHMVANFDFAALVATAVRIRPADDEFYWQGVIVAVLASLTVGIRCSGAITGERERNTWEGLLVTPLDSRRLVRGKLWGIVGASFPYLAAYAGTAMPLAFLGGMAAVFWTIVWLGVTLVAMAYIGAAGLWCSARSNSSWRSLLATVAFGYVGGFVLLFVPTLLVAFIMSGVLYPVLALVSRIAQPFVAGNLNRVLNSAFPIALCLALAAAFCVATELLIASAEAWVNRERIKHWERLPTYRRPGGRMPRRAVAKYGD